MDEETYRIVWTAPEHEHQEHGADWYWATGIIAVSLAIAFIIVSNILLAIIILIGVSTLLYYAKHPPQNITYKLSKKGIYGGETLYLWDSLQSFWILDGQKKKNGYRQPKLILTSKKALMPHIIIILDDDVVEEVHEVLSHMLPEEPQVEPIINRLAHKLGF